jgi:hypothetical protein
MNQSRADLGIEKESVSLGLGISAIITLARKALNDLNINNAGTICIEPDGLSP